MKIWPPSNRNVSYEELESRRYQTSVNLPMWEFEFLPDSYSDEAEYFDRSGQLYRVTPTGGTVSVRNRDHDICKTTESKSRQVLRRCSDLNSAARDR